VLKVKNLKKLARPALLAATVAAVAGVGLSSASSAHPTTFKIASNSGLTLPSSVSDLPKGPPKTAPLDYKAAFFNLIAKNAVVAPSLEILDCHPTPIIISVKLGQNVEVKNSGSSDIIIELTQAHGDSRYIYPIAASSIKSIQADFGKKSGAFAYYCNGNTSPPVGIFYVQ
jgi:hypothetical protein